MYSPLVSFLQDEKIHFVKNHSLKQENTAKIDTVADLSVYPSTVNELLEVYRIVKSLGVKYVTVGNMSNIIFRKSEYYGVVIHTTRLNNYLIDENICSLLSGCYLSTAIRKMRECGYGGAEALVGIPGTVGGMICSNAGAFDLEISDILLDTEIYDTWEDRTIRLTRDKLGFSYRNSMFYNTDRFLILNARISLEPTEASVIEERIALFREKRKNTQPNEPSLGSVFKRVNGIGAGYYIDRAGLKGTRIGGAMVSPQHAGFIVNMGNATAEDFLLLVSIVKEKVYSEFGIHLDTEIKIID